MSTKRFRIAFSFSGAKREFVGQVAATLAKRFGEAAILYDKFHGAEFSRSDLAFYLPDLYEKEAELVVAVICQDYEGKEWCGLEWNAIVGLLKARNVADVMLTRFDRAEGRGLRGLAGYTDLDDLTPDEAAAGILERLALNDGKPKEHYTKPAPPSGKATHTSIPKKRHRLQTLQNGSGKRLLTGGILLMLLTLSAVGIIVVRSRRNPVPSNEPSRVRVLSSGENRIVQSSDWFAIDGQCIAYSSPDTTYKVLQERLEAAKDSILIGVYDFTASYIKDILAKALARQVKVSIIYDGRDGVSDENQIIDELARNGANVTRAPSGSRSAPFPAYHLKVFVVDRNWTFVQSGNFTKTSVPMEGQGNREMGLAVESRELADFFTGVLQSDIELANKAKFESTERELDEDSTAYTPYIHVPYLPELRLTGAASKGEKVGHPTPADKSHNSIRVRPVLSPDHYLKVVEQMLASAQKTVDIQQQYIRPKGPGIQRLLGAIKSTQQKGVQVRVMVRQPFVADGSMKDGFRVLQDAYGWQFGHEIRIFNPRTGMNCGNKLIIVDRKISLVGSANWSEAGVTRSREACLLIDSPEISEYYSRIFQRDWEAGLVTLDTEY